MGSGVSGMFETCMVAILAQRPCVPRLSVSMGDLMHFLAGYTESSVGKGVVSLVWISRRLNGYCNVINNTVAIVMAKAIAEGNGRGIWHYTEKDNIAS